NRRAEGIEDIYLDVILIEIARQEELSDLLTNGFLTKERTHNTRLDKRVGSDLARSIIQQILSEEVPINKKRVGKPELSFDLFFMSEMPDCPRTIRRQEEDTYE